MSAIGSEFEGYRFSYLSMKARSPVLDFPRAGLKSAGTLFFLSRNFPQLHPFRTVNSRIQDPDSQDGSPGLSANYLNPKND
jgi:hypothetical protein